MKLYTKMPAVLRPFYKDEVREAYVAFNKQYYPLSWRHLERAHILAQAYPIEHTAVHWKMFCFGVKVKNYKEVIGEVPRLLVGGVKSFVGKIPVGNTGGANVPPLKHMEIPDDLAQIINKTNNR